MKATLVFAALVTSAVSASTAIPLEIGRPTAELPRLELSLSEAAKSAPGIPFKADAWPSVDPVKIARRSSSAQRHFPMPIVPPNARIDFKMKVAKPDPSIAYKMIVKNPGGRVTR